MRLTIPVKQANELIEESVKSALWTFIPFTLILGLAIGIAIGTHWTTYSYKKHYEERQLNTNGYEGSF